MTRLTGRLLVFSTVLFLGACANDRYYPPPYMYAPPPLQPYVEPIGPVAQPARPVHRHHYVKKRRHRVHCQCIPTTPAQPPAH